MMMMIQGIIWQMVKHYRLSLFWTIILGIICFGCDRRTQLQKIVNISFSVPFVSQSGTVNYYTDDFFILYYKDKVVYELPYGLRKETDTVSKRQLKYFIFKKNEKEGFMYRPIQKERGYKILNVDSLLKAETYSGVNLFDFENDILFKTIEGVDTLKEIYIPKIKKDITFGDTTIISYSKKDIKIDYSLSKKLELFKKRKILKIETIYNLTKQNDIIIKPRIFRFELKEINDLPINRIATIDSLITEFESHSKLYLK